MSTIIITFLLDPLSYDMDSGLDIARFEKHVCVSRGKGCVCEKVAYTHTISQESRSLY